MGVAETGVSPWGPVFDWGLCGQNKANLSYMFCPVFVGIEHVDCPPGLPVSGEEPEGDLGSDLLRREGDFGYRAKEDTDDFGSIGGDQNNCFRRVSGECSVEDLVDLTPIEAKDPEGDFFVVLFTEV